MHAEGQLEVAKQRKDNKHYILGKKRINKYKQIHMENVSVAVFGKENGVLFLNVIYMTHPTLFSTDKPNELSRLSLLSVGTVRPPYGHYELQVM